MFAKLIFFNQLFLLFAFSGRRGIYSSSSGLCIAYLSGLGAAVGGKALWAEMRQAKADPVAASRRINEHDLDVVSSQLQASKSGPVDLLLTAQWPAGIERWTRPVEVAGKEGEKKEKRDSLRFGSALVSRLAKGLEPRYHVAATHGIYYERAPYRNHIVVQERFRAVTRFVGLAAVKNAENQQVTTKTLILLELLTPLNVDYHCPSPLEDERNRNISL